MPLSSAVAGLIGTGVSTLGNLLGGLFSNDVAFKQQQKLAAQQFEYQKQLNQQQMDFNSPVTQMHLWRNAGINPNAVVGNTTSISGGSVGQGTAPSPNLGHIGDSALQAFTQAFSVDSERQQNVANAQAALSQSKALDAQALKSLVETKGINLSNDILAAQSSDFKRKISLENALVRSQIAEADTKSTLNELLATRQVTENRNLQKVIDTDLAHTVASIKLMVADGKLKQAQAVQALDSAILAKAQTVGVSISNRLANATAFDYIRQFSNQADLSKEESTYKSNENDWYGFNHTIGSLLNGIGLFIPAFGKGSPKKVTGFR